MKCWKNVNFVFEKRDVFEPEGRSYSNTVESFIHKFGYVQS